jgi:hypothetical protein
VHPNLKILIIGFVWPEPNSSAAGGRMMTLIRLFQEQNWEITFASPALDSDFMFPLESIGVAKQNILLNDASFDTFVKDLNPSMVLFDRFMIEEQFGWRVAENCPNALRILDSEDLHCLRKARQLAFSKNRTFDPTDLFSDVAKREIASILRCDISLIISEFEMELLQNVFKIDASLLYYLPFLLEPIDETVTSKWPTFSERKNFSFIGNFLHEPNWNAVLYLKETIWPLLKKQFPEANIAIYGAYPSQKVLQLHQPSTGFLIMGRAENAQEVIEKSRVVLAPLRFGAGLKGKLAEAMFCGTPSITTSIGAEAMFGDFEWNGCITDDVDVFVKNAIALYQKEDSWLQAQQNGIQLYNNRFLKSLFAPNFITHLNETKTNLKAHRLKNFMGAMLQHHTLMSAKYMAKWIEAKNK